MPPIHAYNFPTGTALHDGITQKLAFAPKSKLDLVTSVDVQLHNVLARAESFEWEFDLKRMWLGRSRWTAMINQYINPVALEEWLDSCEAKLKGRKRGVSIMRTNSVAQRTNGQKDRVWRRWGSCMLAIGYRSMPEPQITLHSRTSYFGYIAALDLTVAHVCARLIGERVGLAPEEMSFVWHNECTQYHAFKSMAYIMGDEGMRERFLEPDEPHTRESAPALYYSQKWLDGFAKEDAEGKLYGDMNFGQTRRIRKRWHTEVLGYDYGEPFEGGTHASSSQNRRFKPLPSVSSDQLDFSPIFKRARRKPVDQEESLDMVTHTDEADVDDEMLDSDAYREGYNLGYGHADNGRDPLWDDDEVDE